MCLCMYKHRLHACLYTSTIWLHGAATPSSSSAAAAAAAAGFGLQEHACLPSTQSRFKSNMDQNSGLCEDQQMIIVHQVSSALLVNACACLGRINYTPPARKLYAKHNHSLHGACVGRSVSRVLQFKPPERWIGGCKTLYIPQAGHAKPVSIHQQMFSPYG